jgi:ABC-2 type transport system ATP-binding protein
MHPLVQIRDVSKRYGSTTALQDVSLAVPRGQLVGLLGPNGAGKTTLLQLLAGLRRPTSGSIEVLGGDPRDASHRRRLGMTPQETGLPPTLRVREVVDVVAGHYADPVPAGELLGRFGLGAVAGKQIGALSGGQKRRLAVAVAFVGRPDLVLLDEPTTGLDVDARHALWDAIRDFHHADGTVLLTSHYLEEVEALAERVVVVDRGRIRAAGPTAEIRTTVATRTVRLRTPEPVLPSGLPGIERDARDGDRHELWTSDADELVRALVSSGVPFRDLEVATASLEDAFLAITAADAPAHATRTDPAEHVEGALR